MRLPRKVIERNLRIENVENDCVFRLVVLLNGADKVLPGMPVVYRCLTEETGRMERASSYSWMISKARSPRILS